MATATDNNIPLISLLRYIGHENPHSAGHTLDNRGYVQTVDCHVHAHDLCTQM